MTLTLATQGTNRKERPEYVTEQQLIASCKQQDRRAQQLLYDQYAPTMLGVAMRYTVRREDAEDVLVEAFVKVFKNLTQYSGGGSFEGWIRRIVVNEALMLLRKRHALQQASEWDERLELSIRSRASDQLEAADILQLLEQLPPGYRTVFNLYVIEGYKHREIAELLGISINTSKSQLILAKRRLQDMLIAIGHPAARERGEP